MNFRIVHPSYSLPKGQAGKFIFFAPWKIQVDPGATTVVCQHSQVTVQLYVNDFVFDGHAWQKEPIQVQLSYYSLCKGLTHAVQLLRHDV